MQIFGQHFNRNWLIPLVNRPIDKITGNYCGKNYTAKFIITNYAAHIDAHFADIVRGNLLGFCTQSEVPFNFIHFGFA